MGRSQVTCAETLLGVANGLNAGSIAATACIFDAIYESSIGNDRGPNSAGYGGPLGGSITSNGFVAGPSGDVDMATSFYKGGRGFQGGGAIALARTHTDIAYIGSQVTAAVPFDANGYSTQYLSQGFPFSAAIAEAKAIVAAHGGANLKGGVAGAGGSGTIVNGATGSTYAFQIGGTNNPDEDFWTGTNRLAQDVAWYYFSNGEFLYYLDGQEMIAQQPALIIDRIKDAGRFFQGQGSLTWDDTSFQYVANHKRKFRVQRKTALTMATSPTQATLQVICGIDEIRGGDVIELSSFGPGDGRWIVGDCRRSVFNVYSELRLVPPIAPITEVIAAGTSGRNQSSSSGATSRERFGGTPGYGSGPGGRGNRYGPIPIGQPQVTFSRGVQIQLRGLNQERSDQGLDFGTGPNQPIPAVLDGVVTSTSSFGGAFISNGGPGGIVYRTDYGYVFVMENMTPTKKVGDRVKAGETIALGNGQIEMGWANASGTSPLTGWSGDTDRTAGGIGFALSAGMIPITTAHTPYPGFGPGK